MMDDKLFKYENIPKLLKLIHKIKKYLSKLDVIKDGLIDIKIISKFDNIFWYMSINNDLLIKHNINRLREYHYLDNYLELRLIDFLKDSKNEIPYRYNEYFINLIDELIMLIEAYHNAYLYKDLTYDIFSSKVFKFYIINLVYIYIDIYEALCNSSSTK